MAWMSHLVNLMSCLTHTHTQINLVGGLNNIKYHSRENKIGKKNFLKMKY
jgi:16S rRNA C1402 N4-methylase RsmH